MLLLLLLVVVVVVVEVELDVDELAPWLLPPVPPRDCNAVEELLDLTHSAAGLHITKCFKYRFLALPLTFLMIKINENLKFVKILI